MTFPADVFPIPVLVAIMAGNGRATGGTNIRHVRTIRRIEVFVRVWIMLRHVSVNGKVGARVRTKAALPARTKTHTRAI